MIDFRRSYFCTITLLMVWIGLDEQEGRLDETGMLQCSYHGWAFKGDGSCGAIPQAATSGPEAKARFSPRACAVSYPTQVSQGLLFVWPDEKGAEKASQTPPPM